MPIVLDSSTAMALSMDDEDFPQAEKLLAAMTHEPAVAPALWMYEVANSLLAAARRGRMPVDQCQPRLTLVLGLAVDLEESDLNRVSTRTFELAMAHNLTVYDAAYLELAIRRSLPLATLDKALARAARAESVEVIGG